MYDSTNPFDIPTSAPMVGGYVDGIYAWSAAGWARFPNSVKVRIAIFETTNDGHVGDVEPGCMSVTGSVAWVQMRRGAGADPTIYMNASTWPQVRVAFQNAGVREPHYWVASYPGGGAVIPAGAVAHQYANPTTSGGHYDLSAVADTWPGVDRLPSGGSGQLTGTKRSKAIMTVGANSINLFIRGTNLALWQNRFDGISWTGWRTWNGRLGSPEMAVARGTDGSLRVFVHGATVDGTPNGIFEIVSMDDGLTFGAFDQIGPVMGQGDGILAVGVTPSVSVDLSSVLTETSKIETAVAALQNAVSNLPAEPAEPVEPPPSSVDLSTLVKAISDLSTVVAEIKAKLDKDLA
jgi:hypothetical protein